MKFSSALTLYLIVGLVAIQLMPITASAILVWIMSSYMIILYTPVGEVGIKNW